MRRRNIPAAGLCPRRLPRTVLQIPVVGSRMPSRSGMRGFQPWKTASTYRAACAGCHRVSSYQRPVRPGTRAHHRPSRPARGSSHPRRSRCSRSPAGCNSPAGTNTPRRDHRRGGIPASETRAPHDVRLVAAQLGLVDLADERGQHVRGVQVKVVIRAVEIRRHAGDEILPVLLRVRLAELDACDLGRA